MLKRSAKIMIRYLLPMVLLSQITAEAVVSFSYFGTAKTVDALGNPTSVTSGFEDIGFFSSTSPSSTLERSDLNAFSFSTFLLGTDAFGNPLLDFVTFGLEDLTLFGTSSLEGGFSDFQFVAETEYQGSDASEFTFRFNATALRFTAGLDGLGRLEGETAGVWTTLHEGPVSIVPEVNSMILVIGSIPVLVGSRRRRYQE